MESGRLGLSVSTAEHWRGPAYWLSLALGLNSRHTLHLSPSAAPHSFFLGCWRDTASTWAALSVVSSAPAQGFHTQAIFKSLCLILPEFEVFLVPNYTDSSLKTRARGPVYFSAPLRTSSEEKTAQTRTSDPFTDCAVGLVVLDEHPLGPQCP